VPVDPDEYQRLLKFGFIVIGLAIFVFWAVYEGVSVLLDL